jgi:hypothetical protein
MRHYAGILVVVAGALLVQRAKAEEPSAPVRRTQSYAVFPDVTPGPPPSASFEEVKPPPPPDPSLELLATNPYESQLSAALAARNLYGDDVADPYADELRLANPYTDELRMFNPYSRPSIAIANPYSAMRRPRHPAPRNDVDFTNPYSAPAVAPVTPAAPARPGTLFIEAGPSFYGTVFVDGVGVMRGAGLPVLPGPHVVTVYPANGPGYSLQVDVPQGASRHVRVGP